MQQETIINKTALWYNLPLPQTYKAQEEKVLKDRDKREKDIPYN